MPPFIGVAVMVIDVPLHMLFVDAAIATLGVTSGAALMVTGFVAYEA